MKNIDGTHRESVFRGLQTLDLEKTKGIVVEVGCGHREFKPYFEEKGWNAFMDVIKEVEHVSN